MLSSMKVVLASCSPRRIELLSQMNIDFETCPADIDETKRRQETAAQYVKRLSFEKAAKVAHAKFKIAVDKQYCYQSIYSKEYTDDWAVIGADTTVVLNGAIIGKPTDHKSALTILKRLNGKKHSVYTGFSLISSRSDRANRMRRVSKETTMALVSVTELVKTDVYFQKMPSEFLEFYANTNEPLDKAGAYAAQGLGLSMIKRVNGSYSNVIGLPMVELQLAFQTIFSRPLFGGR